MGKAMVMAKANMLDKLKAKASYVAKVMNLWKLVTLAKVAPFSRS